MLNFFRDLFCIQFSKPIADGVKVAAIGPLLCFLFLLVNIAFPIQPDYFTPMLYVSGGLVIFSLLLSFFYKYICIYAIQGLLIYLSSQIVFVGFFAVFETKGIMYFYIASSIAIVTHFLILKFLIYSHRNLDKDNTLKNIKNAMLKNDGPSLEYPNPDLFAHKKPLEQMGDFLTFSIVGYMVVGVVTAYSIFFSSKIFRSFNHDLALTSADPRQFYLAVLVVFFLYPLFSFAGLGMFLRIFSLFLEAGRGWRLSQEPDK